MAAVAIFYTSAYFTHHITLAKHNLRPTGSLHQFLFRMVFYPDYEAGLTENLDAYLFYFLACWLTLIYLMLAFSNPGRIESSVEKFLLNQRF